MTVRRLAKILLLLTVVAAPTFAQLAPLTLDRLVDMVKTLNQQQLVAVINERGVSFNSADENILKLRQAGAPEVVIATVRTKAPPPPPRTGTINVRCTPGECAVQVNQAAAAVSDGGAYTTEAPVGSATITISKDGYVAQKRDIEIRPGSSSDFDIVLAPTEETLAANGKKLLQLALTELGLPQGSPKLSLWNAKGNVTLRNGDKAAEYSFGVAARPASYLDMRAATAKDDAVVLTCEGEACEPPGKEWTKTLKKDASKKLPADVQSDMDAVLRGFARYSLTTVLRTLNSSSVVLSSSTAEPKGGANQVLRAKSGDQEYQLTFGPDLLPSSVEYKSSLAAGVSTAYSAYEDIGNGARYPRRTTIKWTEPKRSLEVNLNKPEVGAGR